MLPTQPSADAQMSAALKRWLHDHWGLSLVEGIILCVLGLAAIILPPLAGLATTVFLGWLFLIAGVVGLVSTLRARQAPGFGWSLLSALLALIVGGVLLWSPLQGLVTLTFVMIAFFIIDGILMIVLAIAHRRELSGKWEWIMANGVIDLILAAIIISGMPGTLIWALGLLVGIDLLFGGAALISMALAARKEALG
ncbi:MAG TPA: DUF308 domain-containing protein [Acetobacteraceae bacterium]|nr:DUF308 domain-containing protein [Acetobacteraceae bacterium]